MTSSQQARLLRIYLAGNMHTDWRAKVAGAVTGCVFLWPREYPKQGGPTGKGADVFFPRDVALLKSADLVFCVIEDEGRNIGTAAEIGMAYAWNKPVVLVNLCPQILSFNFLEKAATSVCYSLPDGLEALRFITSPATGRDN